MFISKVESCLTLAPLALLALMVYVHLLSAIFWCWDAIKWNEPLNWPYLTGLWSAVDSCITTFIEQFVSAHLYQYRISSNSNSDLLSDSDQIFSSQSKFQPGQKLEGKHPLPNFYYSCFTVNTLLTILMNMKELDTLKLPSSVFVTEFFTLYLRSGLPLLVLKTDLCQWSSLREAWHDTTWQGTNSHDAWHSQPASLMTTWPDMTRHDTPGPALDTWQHWDKWCEYISQSEKYLCWACGVWDSLLRSESL